MKAIICGSCGTEFGLTDALYSVRSDDGAWFHCPNGHQNRLHVKAEESLLANAQKANRSLSRELEEWKQTFRHCPICQQRVSQARSPEIAVHKLSLHLQQVHGARGTLLALMPAKNA